MAITFVQADTATVINGGALNLGISGITAGDFILALYVHTDTAGPEDTVTELEGIGWTVITSNADAGLNTILMYVFSPSDEFGTNLDTGGTSDSGVGVAHTFSGVDPTTPLDGVTVTTATSTSTNPDPAAIVPASDDCCVAIFAASAVNDASPSGTITNYLPTTPTSTTASDTRSCSCAAAYRILSGGGGASENPGAFNSWSSALWRTYTVALRPLVVPTGQPYIKRLGGTPYASRRKGPRGGTMWRESLSGLLVPDHSLVRGTT